MQRARSDSPLLCDLPIRPDFSLEMTARREGHWPVAGTDEAGRGPLAGPVVAAAVILDPDNIPDGLDDSKRLDAKARELVLAEIFARAVSVSFASVCAGSIDAGDIRKASLEAMRRAVSGLYTAPLMVLADGRDVPPGLSCAGRAVVKGDQRSQSIAAASIVAKVMRDRMMSRAGSCDGRYGFELHMGYATVRHREAVTAHGPVARMHRMSFAPFKA
ncbi:ribonuclease HII [Mesorhizobium sp. CAU 1741]|uniref:ribonuclease HII n=1 Tax=Mesorhizobium sp. CAU 1741 TaxID=3140366 RepID=UPI00325C2108